MSQVLDRPPVTLDQPVATPDEPEIPGLLPLRKNQVKLQRRLVLVVTILPFLGFILAVWRLWGHGITAVDFGIFLATYVIAGIGITVGFHRLFTHRAFVAKPALRNFLAITGSMAIEGPILKWVADHRRHHAFADQPGDPHSPHLDEGPGIRGVVKGLWHAHIGWFFETKVSSIKRWAPDLYKDETLRRIDKLFPLWVLISLGAPAVLGLVITQTWSGAFSAFLWGGLVRIFMLHHVTWSINSICHFYGRRPFETTDQSTNNWPLALISFGESWHNNHHAFPTSATHGMTKAQVDPGTWAIKLFEKTGLASDVKLIPEETQATKRVSAARASSA